MPALPAMPVMRLPRLAGPGRFTAGHGDLDPALDLVGDSFEPVHARTGERRTPLWTSPSNKSA